MNEEGKRKGEVKGGWGERGCETGERRVWGKRVRDGRKGGGKEGERREKEWRAGRKTGREGKEQVDLLKMMLRRM